MRLTYTLSVVALLCPAVVSAADWTIPVAGNIYQTSPAPGRTNPWTSTNVVHSVYVHVDRAATLELSIEAGTEGTSEIETRVGEQKFAVQIGQSTEQISVGSVKVTEPGYVRVDFQGVKKSGRSFGRIEEVLIKSDTPDLKLTYVRDNNGGMFYWGRRGPSVHLSYSVPRNVDLTYAYSEVTVPNDVSISPEQAKRNKLRCYWSVVKAAERICKRSSPRVLCEARTHRWLQQNFAWTPAQMEQACDDNQGQVRFRNLMINIRQ